MQDQPSALPFGGRYTWQFHSRHYELGVGGLVRPEVYLNWLQEVGLLASSYGKWPLSRYEAHGAFWWVRRFSMEWHDWVGYREAMEATTWISEFRRIRCHREYEVRRADGPSVFSAQAEWAFIDVRAGRPTAIPEEMLRAFPPYPRTALQPFAWPETGSRPPAACTSSRQVHLSECDTMGHVNNATYLAWLCDNLSAAGLTDPRPLRFDIEYVQQVRAGMELAVAGWHAADVADGTLWRQEIHDDKGTLLARALSVLAAA